MNEKVAWMNENFLGYPKLVDEFPRFVYFLMQ